MCTVAMFMLFHYIVEEIFPGTGIQLALQLVVRMAPSMLLAYNDYQSLQKFLCMAREL